MPRSFDLNKTWIPGSSRGTTTFNASGNINIAYGRNKTSVSGRGGSGVAPSYNTVTNYPYTAASYNTVTNYPYTPVSYPFTPVSYPFVPASYNTVPASYNTVPASYNTVTNYPFTPVSYNTVNSYPYVPGNPGTPTTVLGVYFPGGGVGAVAPYVSETVTNYWDYPDNATYPVAVPTGGYIVVKVE